MAEKTLPDYMSGLLVRLEIWMKEKRPFLEPELTLNSGQFLFRGLPYSKIEIDIPVIWQASALRRPDEGVIPDFVFYHYPKRYRFIK
ncbi:hypothetical protein [Flavobacterium sp. FlaQc-48]|uniref:hypothetical protein n=1 Tax=Flavobacterium sp. FlaQc-48 TaxID=3374181 RepID=UPI003757CE7A